jgi:hypothetical protein
MHGGWTRSSHVLPITVVKRARQTATLKLVSLRPIRSATTIKNYRCYIAGYLDSSQARFNGAIFGAFRRDSVLRTTLARRSQDVLIDNAMTACMRLTLLSQIPRTGVITCYQN